MEKTTLFHTVKEFMNTHRKAVFSILDANGLPTTSLMLYATDDDLNVYFGTRRSFAKYTHLIERPVVALSVIEENIDPRKVVDIRGDVSELSVTDCQETLAWFKEKNPSKYYVEGADDFTMFKLTPHFMRWLDAESGTLETVDLL